MNPLAQLQETVVDRKAPVVKYNPFSVVKSQKQQDNFYFNSNQGQPVVEPILYDPVIKKSIFDF